MKLRLKDEHTVRVNYGVLTNDGSGNIGVSWSVHPKDSNMWDDLNALYGVFRIKEIRCYLIPLQTTMPGIIGIAGELTDESAGSLTYTNISTLVEDAEISKVLPSLNDGRKIVLSLRNPSKDFHQLDSTLLDEGAFPQAGLFYFRGAYGTVSANYFYVFAEVDLTVGRA